MRHILAWLNCTDYVCRGTMPTSSRKPIAAYLPLVISYGFFCRKDLHTNASSLKLGEQIRVHTAPHLSGRCSHRPLRINLPSSTKRPQFSCIGTAYKQLDKPGFSAPSIDAHRTLGSPFGRAVPEGLRGLIAPISLQFIYRTTAPIPYTKLHSCTNCLHIPLPLPSGGTSTVGRGKGCVQT